MTVLTDTFVADWQTWHASREAYYAEPHGWVAITALHWLTAEPAVFDFPSWNSFGPSAEAEPAASVEASVASVATAVASAVAVVWVPASGEAAGPEQAASRKDSVAIAWRMVMAPFIERDGSERRGKRLHASPVAFR